MRRPDSVNLGDWDIHNCRAERALLQLLSYFSIAEMKLVNGFLKCQSLRLRSGWWCCGTCSRLAWWGQTRSAFFNDYL